MRKKYCWLVAEKPNEQARPFATLAAPSDDQVSGGRDLTGQLVVVARAPRRPVSLRAPS
jgi:hypothetical protein